MRAVAQEQGGKTLAQVRAAAALHEAELCSQSSAGCSLHAGMEAVRTCLLPAWCGPSHLWCGPPISQVAINWTMCKGALPIPGAKRAEQARAHAACRMPWLLLLGFDVAYTPALPLGLLLMPWLLGQALSNEPVLRCLRLDSSSRSLLHLQQSPLSTGPCLALLPAIPWQVHEIAGALGWRLTDAQVAELDAVSAKVPRSTGAPFENW